MKLIPINEKLEDNHDFVNNPLCQESIYMTIDFFKRVGYVPPWISYYVQQGNALMGCAAFKGAPRDGSVEIAYGTFEPYRRKGVGTEICRLLVELSLKTDPTVTITARTLPEKNFSTRILEKNGFAFSGVVNDPEDGEVWEWVLLNKKAE
jgi:Acetyltransferases, including N-acetylases of ribosomal proteins